ncbi:hypothetical protein DPX16_1008 [Anabarilius grahami]|uniref:Ig-like domain-containing protein n=1 Tax=Anabarilius grahami TaxID=495550 RepID=A0A3N0XR56_ANAGA|nr:hypothetical protein DPX16_1008 [Anabarilius grahami]
MNISVPPRTGCWPLPGHPCEKILAPPLGVGGVFGAETDEVKTVSVMEGDSVSLNPDLTQIQGINLILWRFGDTGFTIAQVEGNEISYDPDERFRDRLKLDRQTGSLTITNIRIKHSGLYKAEIIHNSGTAYRKFTVIVYESPDVIEAFKGEMKSVSETEGESVTLQTDTETHSDELIVWRFGDEGKLIAKHDLEAKSPPLYDPDERFRDRLKLDHQTGSLTITKFRITDSGVYKVKISSSKQTLHKRFTVTVSVPALSSGAVAGIVVVVLLVLSAAAGVFYHRLKVSELQNQTNSALSSGAVAGIVVVVLLVLSAAAGVFYHCLKVSELQNQTSTEVTNQQTTRSDLEKGGEERRITVQDTAISQATGDDKTCTEVQSKKISIRKNSSEDAGVHTHDPTVVTPLLKKRDGENKPEDTTPG